MTTLKPFIITTTITIIVTLVWRGRAPVLIALDIVIINSERQRFRSSSSSKDYVTFTINEVIVVVKECMVIISVVVRGVSVVEVLVVVLLVLLLLVMLLFSVGDVNRVKTLDIVIRWCCGSGVVIIVMLVMSR